MSFEKISRAIDIVNQSKALRHFKYLTLRLVQVSFRHWTLVLITFVPLFFGCLAGLKQLKFDLNVYRSPESGFIGSRNNKLLLDNFGGQSDLLVIFESKEKISKRQYCFIRQWAKDHYRKIDAIENIRSGAWMYRPIFQKEKKKLWFTEFVEFRCPNDWSTADTSSIDLNDLALSPLGPIFTDQEGRDISIQIDLSPKLSSAEKHAAFAKILTDLNERAKSAELVVHMAGPTAFSYYVDQVLKSDFVYVILLNIFFLVFFRLFFGSWKSGLIYFSTLFVNFCLLFGLMGWLGQPIDMMVNGLIILVCISTVEDFIFLSYAQKTSVRLKSAFLKVAFPCFLTTVTTVVGFWSLGIANIESIRIFGFWVGISAIFEWILLFSLLPALCKFTNLTPWHVSSSISMGDLLNLPQRVFNSANRKVILALLGIPFVMIPWSVINLSIEDTTISPFPKSHVFTKSQNYLSSSRGWVSTLSILRPDETIAESSNFSHVSKIRHVLNKESVIDHALLDIPDHLHAYLKDRISNSRRMDFLSNANFNRDILFIDTHYFSDLDGTIQSLFKYCEDNGCIPAGQFIVYWESMKRVVSTLLKSFATSLAFIFIVLILLMKSSNGKVNWTLLACSFWGPVATLFFVAILSVQINLITNIFVAILVGLAGDNAIHFLTRKKSDLESSISFHRSPVFMFAILLSSASLFLVLQNFLPTKTLGAIFAVAFLLNFVGDYLIAHKLIKNS